MISSSIVVIVIIVMMIIVTTSTLRGVAWPHVSWRTAEGLRWPGAIAQ